MTIPTTPEAPKRGSKAGLKGAPLKKRKVTDSPVTPPVPVVLPPSSPSDLAISLSYLKDNFETTKVLGTGCFGVVRKVRGLRVEQDFALKESKVDKSKVKTGHNFTKAQLQEIFIHKSLAYHPNIVYFLEAWRENRSLYLLMELCDCSLDDFWSSEEVLAVMDIHTVQMDVLRALHFLGSSNIGHFDVKPANILKKGPQYKLADFTVATRLDKLEKDPEFGESHYAAPELYIEQFTLKADIYSLGVSIVQVSVSSKSVLTEKEWIVLKEEERMPARVAEVLSCIPGLQERVLSMIQRNPIKRASTGDLLKGYTLELVGDNNGAGKVETLKSALKHHRGRLSLPADVERELREPASPLIAQADELIFDTDPAFFVMPSPVHNRFSFSARRMGGTKLNFDQ